MEPILAVAKELLDLNPNASLTGTLMLKLRGIDLGREPHDIDILFKDFADNFKFPADAEVENLNEKSYHYTTIKYKYKGFIIDVLSCNTPPEIVNGWRLGSVEELMQAKYEYSKQDNASAQKHYNDLVKLGFSFPAE